MILDFQKHGYRTFICRNCKKKIIKGNYYDKFCKECFYEKLNRMGKDDND
jgi:hypothetical protein